MWRLESVIIRTPIKQPVYWKVRELFFEYSHAFAPKVVRRFAGILRTYVAGDAFKQCLTVTLILGKMNRCDTVDGRNPAPVDM